MLFFEYYTKYDSSPTEHQVFTSPPTERSIYFVDHHVLPLSVFIFQEHSSVSELVLRGSPRPLRCLRTLSRPRSCSGTSLQTTLCSGTSRQTTLRSGSSCQTTPCSGYIARPLRARDIYVHRIRVYACERHGHASARDISPDHSVLRIYTCIVYRYMHVNVMWPCKQTGSKQGQGIYGYMHVSYMDICMQTSWPCKQSGATRIHVHAYTLHSRPRLLLTRSDARQPLAPVDYGIRSTRGKAGKDVRQHHHEADASKQGQVCMHIRVPCSSTSISKSQA